MTRMCWSALVGLCLVSLAPLSAQEASTGFTAPMTLSAGALYTHRLQTSDVGASPEAAAFRAMFYPTLRLGSHWFATAAVQVHMEPYFYPESYAADHEVKVNLMQAYVGYTRATGKKSVTFKAGKLISAFGSFPLRYDDATNPLIDSPMTYGGSDYGKFPVTLYGLPGAQAEVTFHRADARLQFTNSSPANSQTLLSHDQNPNWTAGAGYTIRQGFRVGASAVRGGYLTLGPFLTPADNPRDWPLSGVGADLQWARSRWSVNAEWQRFYYFYPRFARSPSLQAAYVELKTVIRPRLYAATRIQYRHSIYGRSLPPTRVISAPAREVYEFALGWHINRSQLLKLDYEWLRADNLHGSHDNVLGVQFVTSLDRISKAFH